VALGIHGMTNGLLPARYHVPASLAAATAASVLAARGGADLQDQGLDLRDGAPGAAYGLGIGTSVACAILAGRALSGAGPLYGQGDIAEMTAARAAYEALVRVPLGTALPEELLFRGALLGLLSKRHTPALATALTSVLFGLWHITPTFQRLETHAVSAGRHPAHKAAWVATTVGVTAGAGVLLAGLRYRSRSLLAPWLVHSAANAAGLAATWLAARHRDSSTTQHEPQPGEPG
jgi:membrane protease YdiL (CAAX protease family)